LLFSDDPGKKGFLIVEQGESCPMSKRLKIAGGVLWNVVLLSVGAVFCGAAVNGILIPMEFVSGGVTGLTLVVKHLLPSLPLGGIYLCLNVPLFLVGWRFVGRRFFLYSLAGMVLFSAALQWIHVTIPVEDRILGALLAGIIMGIGTGITLKSAGSGGGTDILAVILLKHYSIRLGTTVLVFNTTVLALAALLFSLQGALYTLIFLYVSSKVLNVVVTGLSQRKAVWIVSRAWEEINREILEDLSRGVTIIEGRGGFTGQRGALLYTVITFQELARLKRIIRRLDPEAFVVVSETLEVMGHRIGNQPHW